MKLHPSWEAKPASIRFRLAGQYRRDQAAGAAIAVLDNLQHIPADEQLSSVFVAAAVLANAAGADAHEMVTRAKKVVADLEDETLRAIGDYGAGELRR